MAGSMLVFMAIAGGAVFMAALLKRRVAEMVPLSVLFLIAHTYLCAQVGLLRFSVYAGVFGMTALGVVGLIQTLRGRWKPQWDASLLLLGLGFAWLLYSSRGRMPLLQEDYTQWALMAKAMFYTGSLTPAAGTLAYAPAMAVFQTVFQVSQSLFTPGAGFTDWLLYVAYGTACLALLTPLVAVTHPRRWVRAGYTLLFFLVLVCVPLHAFDLFSALNPDGFLAILAAVSFLTAAQQKSTLRAIRLGLYLFVLTLAKDAGLYFALSALALYGVTLRRDAGYQQSARGRRTMLFAVPAAWVLLARLSWLHPGFSLHGATAGILPLFWQSFTAKMVSYRVALTLGGGTVFTLFTAYASFLAITIALACGTALLVHALQAKETLRDVRTALWIAPAVTAVFAAGLWLSYVFVIGADDAAKLLNFQRLLSIGYVYWGLVVAASAFKVLADAPRWTWRRHLLTVLACVCVVLAGSGALTGLTGRDFASANEKYHTYYAVADEAQRVIANDARVYIVSQNDDGTSYHTLRYALYPRQTNLGATYWLRDPEDKQYTWTYPVTAEAWQAQLADYDYVLVYQADDYVQTAIARAVTADGSITANTLYAVNHDTGLLEALPTEEIAQ
ncbi:MAG TPA: hypothetical protein PK537_00135 [Candidatus Limiplasma sp.]|nr:hypothetical protein [Candidatus Limiplasma sp.]